MLTKPNTLFVIVFLIVLSYVLLYIHNEPSYKAIEYDSVSSNVNRISVNNSVIMSDHVENHVMKRTILMCLCQNHDAQHWIWGLYFLRINELVPSIHFQLLKSVDECLRGIRKSMSVDHNEIIQMIIYSNCEKHVSVLSKEYAKARYVPVVDAASVVPNRWVGGLFWDRNAMQSSRSLAPSQPILVKYLGEVLWAPNYKDALLSKLAVDQNISFLDFRKPHAFAYRSMENSPENAFLIHMPRVLDWGLIALGKQGAYIDRSGLMNASQPFGGSVFGRSPLPREVSIDVIKKKPYFCVFASLTVMKSVYRADAIVRHVIYRQLNRHRLKHNRQPCVWNRKMDEVFKFANGSTWQLSKSEQARIRSGLQRPQTASKGIRDFRFNIAGSNQFEHGYMVERMTNALVSETTPIYIGAPDIDVHFNPKRFVQCHINKNVLQYLRSKRTNRGLYWPFTMPKCPPTKQSAQPAAKALDVDALLDFADKLLEKELRPCILQIDQLDTDINKMADMVSRKPITKVENSMWDGTYGAVAVLQLLRQLRSPLLFGIADEVQRTVASVEKRLSPKLHNVTLSRVLRTNGGNVNSSQLCEYLTRRDG